MPIAYKTLGQSNPSATTLTTLYTVPASTSAIVSTITVANLATTAATYRIAIRKAGAAIANQQYIAYDITLDANSSYTWTIGAALATTDIISVYASSATVAFNAFGSEIS